MRAHGEWSARITQDEVDALVAATRLHDLTHDWVQGKGWVPKNPVLSVTPEMVNDQQRRGGLGGHDAINRGILIDARLKRLGLPLRCSDCEGHGYVFTADTAHLTLVLWLIHPRKGCSRGVEVKNIQETELPAVRDWLLEAAVRNAKRFAGAVNLGVAA